MPVDGECRRALTATRLRPARSTASARSFEILRRAPSASPEDVTIVFLLAPAPATTTAARAICYQHAVPRPPGTSSERLDGTLAVRLICGIGDSLALPPAGGERFTGSGVRPEKHEQHAGRDEEEPDGNTASRVADQRGENGTGQRRRQQRVDG